MIAITSPLWRLWQFLKKTENDNASPLSIGAHFVDQNLSILAHPVDLLTLHRKAIQMIVGQCVIEGHDVRPIVSYTSQPS